MVLIESISIACGNVRITRVKCQSKHLTITHYYLQALKVHNEALDHIGQTVPVQTLLFNIREVSQRVGLWKKSGVEGVDCMGRVHRFLEGKGPLSFSTQLYDVKCIPKYFTEVVQFPRPARVYLPSSTAEGEDANALQNLSTVIVTGVDCSQSLVVRKLSCSGDQLGPTFTVPLNADLKV